MSTSSTTTSPQRGMKQKSVTVTYLEQTEKTLLHAPVPNAKIALLRIENPPIHYYRYLYKTVGEPYNWVSRALYNDEQLSHIITNPKVHIYVLYINGVPGGFTEIDGRHEKIPEIKFFGLAPEFIGKGFGRYFFNQAIDIAWNCTQVPDRTSPGLNTGTHDRSQTLIGTAPSHGPRCVRIETCSLDHPAALPLYQKFGFNVIDRREGLVPVLMTNQD